MSSRPTPDSEIVEFLRAIRTHGSQSKAAEAIGLALGNAGRLMRAARDRGLTADSPILDRAEKLEIELKAARRDISALQREADSAERIRTEIFNLAARSPEPPAWIAPARAPHGTRGTPMTLWSDWHYGEVVRKEEVGGLNTFNAEVAQERVKRLVDTTVDLCFNHMGRAETKYPGIVVCLGGDMITGDIHEELVDTNDRTTQQCINELTDIIAAALEEMADKFGKVFVPCVVGNHGRATRKPRMKGRVFTSHEWNIYCNLERYFRKDKRIQFMISGEADAYFKVYGHRFLLTHGDSLGVKGGDGIIGAIGPIMRGTIKTAHSEAQVGRDIDTILLGHWHQTLWLPQAIVNGALKGYDEYAKLALRAPYSRPAQSLWFVHPDHGITAKWEVYLEGKQTAAAANEWIGWQAAAE